MGLRDEIQAGIAEAFDGELADAVKPFTGRRESASGAYDATTGTYGSTTIEYAGRGVFGGYSAMEIDGTQIMATDVRLIALQSELFLVEAGEVTSNRAEPKVDDVVNGYAVVNVGADPASATWRIQIRRT